MVVSLTNTIPELEVFEEKAKNNIYQATHHQSALDFWGSPYKLLIDLCKKLLSIFAINHFRNELIDERTEFIHEDEKNNQEAWRGLQILF